MKIKCLTLPLFLIMFNLTYGNCAVTFVNVADAINVPNSTSLNIIGATLSISIWAKSTSGTPANFATILEKDNGTGTTGYGLLSRTTGQTLTFQIGTGSNHALTSTTFVWGTGWHFIVATYDGANMRLYEDGIEDAASPKAQTGNIGDSSAQTLRIGQALVQDGDPVFVGTLDEARIYNRTLSATEVKSMYLCRCRSNILEKNNLVGYWPLNDSNRYGIYIGSATVIDISGNGNTGTMAGSQLFFDQTALRYP